MDSYEVPRAVAMQMRQRYFHFINDAQGNPSRFSRSREIALAWADAYEMVTGQSLLLKKKITLEQIDDMAKESFVMTGDILIQPLDPPDPSVGIFGWSFEPTGNISGRFEVPTEAIKDDRLKADDSESMEIGFYIRESDLWQKIEAYCRFSIGHPEDYKYDLDIVVAGTKKGSSRTVIDFEVKVKEILEK